MDELPATVDPSAPPPDPWTALRVHTPARIALGRTGAGLPTQELLRFGAAHAQARDAVHLPLDVGALAAAAQADGWAAPLCLASRAPTRDAYLRRPDWGRRLDEASAARLAAGAAPADAPPDLAIVLGDGLSALAVQRHALATLASLRAALAHRADGVSRAEVATVGDAPRLAPLVIATQARVALADEVGELLRARLVLILLGERPGLSAPDSLGAYLTWAPRIGRADSERNCVSNIRPDGLAPDAAGRRLAWLVGESLRRRVSGIALKDDSDTPLVPHTAA